MTTVDNHHIVNSHSSVTAINGSSIKTSDGQVVHDEEIDSAEGDDYDEKMFQVALVNSVMDTGGNGGVNHPALDQAPGEMSPRSKARYALRKRRRPGEEAPAPPPMASNVLDLPNDPLNELQHVQDMPLPPIHQTATMQIKQEPQQQHNIGVIPRGHSTQGTISKPPNSSAALLPNTTFQAPQQRRPTANTKKKPARKRKARPAKSPAKTKVAERLSMPVPNPLLASSSPAPSMNRSVLRAPSMTSSSSVPCPLSVPSPLDAGSSMQIKPTKKLVTPSYIPPFDPSKLTKISETTSLDFPLTRTRVFSVDLDRKSHICHATFMKQVSIFLFLSGCSPFYYFSNLYKLQPLHLTFLILALSPVEMQTRRPPTQICLSSKVVIEHFPLKFSILLVTSSCRLLSPHRCSRLLL